MTRQTRQSKALTKAIRRSTGIRSINNNLAFSEELSLVNYEFQIQDLQAQLYQYNSLTAELDSRAKRIAIAEEALGVLSEKMLSIVATQYGKTSPEYGIAGGTIRKLGKRSPKSTAPTPTTATPTISVERAATNGKGKVTALN
jgi:hypothetical protein